MFLVDIRYIISEQRKTKNIVLFQSDPYDSYENISKQSSEPGIRGSGSKKIKKIHLCM